VAASQVAASLVAASLVAASLVAEATPGWSCWPGSSRPGPGVR